MNNVVFQKARIHYVSGVHIYVSRGANLFKSLDAGKTWQLLVVLPVGFWRRIGMGMSLLSRLFRLGVHHLAFSGENAVAIANKDSFLIESDRGSHLGSLHGSRPMVLCALEGVAYYGEYRSNQERSSVRIWRLDFSSRIWSPIWRFDAVRHVHGVFYDHYTNAIWVTTGDEDSESVIWRTDDNFASIDRVVGGAQQLRAVQLLFTREYVYFGSDAPAERNHIYRMDRNGGNIERLIDVGSSVFYGCKVGESLFFSTAIEPSEINTSCYAEVWRSDNGRDWYRFLQFKKDLWSMKYFQYGQIFFPAGQGDDKHLYCTPFATKGHGKTFKINIVGTEGVFLGDLS